MVVRILLDGIVCLSEIRVTDVEKHGSETVGDALVASCEGVSIHGHLHRVSHLLRHWGSIRRRVYHSSVWISKLPNCLHLNPSVWIDWIRLVHFNVMIINQMCNLTIDGIHID
jgi:hypothetical protein